jgi:hypothetical protein
MPVLSATYISAQAAQDVSAPSWEVGPYVGIGHRSLVDTALDLGLTPDRDHVFIGIHFTRPIRRYDHATLAYAPELVPVLIITNNPTYSVSQSSSPPAGSSQVLTVTRGPVAGFAFSPFGLEGQFPVGRRWNLFAAGAAGGVVFARDVPDMYGRRFNFTFEVGSGVRWRYGERTALRLGVKFHHLSNARTAPYNPGIDGAIFMVGFDRVISSRSNR